MEKQSSSFILSQILNSDNTQYFENKHLSLSPKFVRYTRHVKNPTIWTAEIISHTKFAPQNLTTVLKILPNLHKHLLNELTENHTIFDVLHLL